MAKKTINIKELNPRYFWDTDIGKLDLTLSKRLIIERVFSLGKLDEMFGLIDFYGKSEVLETLCHINYLDPKTLNFVVKLFKIPKSRFKCYSPTPLTSRHWNS
jgi:hypothetical protein